MANILVIRLSAIGDVAMLLPVLYATARLNPEHRLVLLTQPFLAGLLISPPENLSIVGVDIKKKEKGLGALVGYARKLRKENWDMVIDLHGVIRSRIVSVVLSALSKTQVYRIEKPRAQRKSLLLHPDSTPMGAIPPMYSIYMEALGRAGLHLPLSIDPIPLPETLLQDVRARFIHLERPLPLIGIAPFASSQAKTYDLEQMERLVSEISIEGAYRIYLFGGRGREQEILSDWANRYRGVISVAGLMKFSEELALMSQLDLMLSMDSANMHLASMVGTRVLSLWCATDPRAGFLGIGQRVEDCLTASSRGLSCAPCSIFGGNSQCKRRDWACRKAYQPQSIKKHIDRVVGLVSKYGDSK